MNIKSIAVVLAGMATALAPEIFACAPSKDPAVIAAKAAPASALAAARWMHPIAEASRDNQAGDNSPFIVGMWEVTMRSGGALYDHAYQQLYADGNELQNSGLYAPETGNICLGTWKQVDARTFKLKHYGWLFDKGAFIGTFILTATITVGTPAGINTYFGNFVADVVLPSGKVDPTQHADGTVQAVRLMME